jgi:hypothetical protein
MRPGVLEKLGQAVSIAHVNALDANLQQEVSQVRQIFMRVHDHDHVLSLL